MADARSDAPSNAQAHSPGAWADMAYSALYDGGYAAEEAEDTAELERSDVAKLVEVLRGCVRVVNEAPLTARDWVRYKRDLLQHEQEWGEAMFSWRPTPEPVQQPDGLIFIRGLDVLWAKLEAMPEKQRAKACYVLHLAFSNAWFGPQLPNIYEAMGAEM